MTEQRACHGGDTTTVVRPFTHSQEFERCTECRLAVAWDKVNCPDFGFKGICNQAKETL
ncbi:hypothetical protein [Zavarzinella formosa]|uniref:hypothetical protein n=1 Tax=Zavarzinella formosa TaxID=360055 RepID=UPI0002EE3028|nr:hypothetical protein [Zavarzinella formosa]